jgi:hypothetical protein
MTLSPFDKTITLCCTCLKFLNNKYIYIHASAHTHVVT